jgi:hypothetical protein
MMDELELLKKDWKKQEKSLPKLSYDEIYKLIHKKSSSIVKWIFIIGIAEFLFWAGLNLIIPDDYLEIYKQFHLENILFGINMVHYGITVVFLYLFYKNYKAICVKDSTTVLMNRILKTRKTVNYYVYYNIIMFVGLSIAFNIVMFSNPDLLMEFMEQDNATINSDSFLNILLVVQIITVVFVSGLLLLWYRVIYGILLRKLKKNYNELKTLEA